MRIAMMILTIGVLVGSANAQPGWVLSHQKISDTEGGFKGILDDEDLFGRDIVPLGDLDGDGVGDIAVGANFDDDGGNGHGAVWILFLNPDQTVKSHQKISDTEGGFTGKLSDGDFFGTSLAALGDLDGDGVGDLAVGAVWGGGNGHPGAMWVLFLNADGTVKSHHETSASEFGWYVTNDFGMSMASLGDFDGDGVTDLAVGAPGDYDGGDGFGAVWILFLNSDGTVKTHQKISNTEGGFTGVLDDDDWFGSSVEIIGDLDGDGVDDLAVGAIGDDDGGEDRGAVWILFLNPDATVKSHQKISQTEGGFTGILDDSDWFGRSVASIGDLDGDGVIDLAVGADRDDDGGETRGSVWILFLNSDGTVKDHQKISDNEGNFTGTLDDGDFFGVSMVSLGDLNGDGISDLAVGARGDDDGGNAHGAIWILYLDGSTTGSCPWDLDNSGSVGTSDLLALFAQWGTDGSADFDGSGDVGTSDLLILFANWGPCK